MEVEVIASIERAVNPPSTEGQVFVIVLLL
jgi:hypothetical protein